MYCSEKICLLVVFCFNFFLNRCCCDFCMSIFFSSFPPCLVTPNEPFQRVTSQPYHSRSSLWMSPKASWSLSLFSLRILTSSFTEMIFCTPVPDQIKGKKKHVTWHILYTINLLLLCSSLFPSFFVSSFIPWTFILSKQWSFFPFLAIYLVSGIFYLLCTFLGVPWERFW